MPLAHNTILYFLDPYCRMGPDDDKKFKKGRVESLMQDVMETFFKGYKYDASTCAKMTCDITSAIKQRVMDLAFPRYKIVTHVLIGEHKSQGIQSASRFLWDAKNDNHAQAVYNAPGFFAVATVYGVYAE